jgi:hypothetical protein
MIFKINVMRKTIYIFTLAGLLALLTCSCVWDEGNLDPLAGDDALVTLAVNLPASPPASRAGDGPDENAVNAVDVLLFDVNDKYFYRAVGTSIIPDGTDETKKTFTARLPQGGPYKIVVLANATDMLGNYPPSVPRDPSYTVTREALLEGLVQELAVKTHKWNEEFTHIPMWGYYGSAQMIDETTEKLPNSISLTRAIARVDVTISANGTVRDDFDLEEVYLYNYNRAGTLTPAVNASGYVTDQHHLPALSLLADKSTPLKVEGPLAYLAADGLTADGLTKVIYTFEAAAATVEDISNTCLVIGGKYYDGVIADPPVTYYRLEFVSKGTGGSPEYFALLRNHCYTVNITAVKGHGYDRKEDAYSARPVNIEATVTAWDDEQLDNEFPGQYYLNVDKSRVEITGINNPVNITVTTNYDGSPAWSIEGTPSWLTASTTSSKLTLRATATGSPTSFYIVAGNIKKKIDVTWSADEKDFDLSVTDEQGNPVTELFFGPGTSGITPPPAQKIYVTWKPTTINCTITKNTVSSLPAFEYRTGGGLFAMPGTSPLTLTGGTAELTIQPPALTQTGVYTRASRLEFSIGLGNQNRMLPLYLRQVNYALEVSGVAANYLAGGEHSFTVKSTCPWVAEINDPSGIFQETPISGGANATGQFFTFKLKSGIAASATVTFKSPGGLFNPVPVTITSRL